MQNDSPPVPAYGRETLAELLPSAAALILDDPAAPDPLGLTDVLSTARGIVVYLVDGLGLEIIEEFAAIAPTLARLRATDPSRALRTCVPSTTATSITSVGTGRPPGEHGLVGYSVFLAEIETVVNLIHFTKYGSSSEGPIDDKVVPEQIQPRDTVFDRLTRAGYEAFNVAPAHFEDTPLTRAALRGPRFVGYDSADAAVGIIADILDAAPSRLVYTYFADLDFQGHVNGVGSDEFCEQLRTVDALVQRLTEELPDGVVLLVTGDHGMMNLDEAGRIDVDAHPELTDGVRALSGEPRFRHIHVVDGARDTVRDNWRHRFGDAAWLATRDDAIRAGWFGPHVDARVARLVGDVVVAFRDPVGVFQPAIDPLQARLVGHHGSFTETESVVPLLIHQS